MTDESFLLERLRLERLRLVAAQRVTRPVLENARFTVDQDDVTDFIANTLLVQLETEVYAVRVGGERIQRSEDVTLRLDVEDGPVQRWKARHTDTWWLRWYVRRRPVRWIHRETHRRVLFTVDVRDYATFPDSTVTFPPEFGVMVCKRTTEAWTDQC